MLRGLTRIHGTYIVGRKRKWGEILYFSCLLSEIFSPQPSPNPWAKFPPIPTGHLYAFSHQKATCLIIRLVLRSLENPGKNYFSHLAVCSLLYSKAVYWGIAMLFSLSHDQNIKPWKAWASAIGLHFWCSVYSYISVFCATRFPPTTLKCWGPDLLLSLWFTHNPHILLQRSVSGESLFKPVVPSFLTIANLLCCKGKKQVLQSWLALAFSILGWPLPPTKK